MKKVVIALLAIICVENICLGSALHNIKELRETTAAPAPVVIHSGITAGVYEKGEISFSGEGVTSKHYEGPVKIKLDHGVLKIFCGDNVMEGK